MPIICHLLKGPSTLPSRIPIDVIQDDLAELLGKKRLKEGGGISESIVETQENREQLTLLLVTHLKVQLSEINTKKDDFTKVVVTE